VRDKVKKEQLSKKDKKKISKAITIIVAAADLMLLALLVVTQFNDIARLAIGVAILGVSGEFIRKSNGLEGAYGLYMLGSRHGIKTINSLAKNNKSLWNFIADFGLAISFGMFSYLLLRKRNLKAFLLGIAAIAIIAIYVFPNLGIMLEFMPMLSGRLVETEIAVPTAAQVAQANLLLILILFSSIIGGFALLTVSLLLYSGASVVYAIFAAVAKANYSALSSEVPGVFPIIPGITIPLLAGIISLAILLIVHEFSHGILARIAKVKINSVGIVLFGIIPFGAFVEPNEKQVKKLDKEKQNRIFIAGISSNILLSLAFFALTLLVVEAVLPGISTGGVKIVAVVPGTPANSLLSSGMTILKWNNYTISNEYSLQKAESQYVSGNVMLLTNKGEISIKPMSNGRLGIELGPAETGLSYQAAYFMLEVFALSFALNFFVGIFNLLPLPGFDGWRIYENEIKSKKVLNAMLAVVLLSILLNVLPWFWFF